VAISHLSSIRTEWPPHAAEAEAEEEEEEEEEEGDVTTTARVLAAGCL